jgi:hypothetical protein
MTGEEKKKEDNYYKYSVLRNDKSLVKFRFDLIGYGSISSFKQDIEWISL